MDPKDVDLATKQEMEEFITGLFKEEKPKPDKSWSLAMPDISMLKGENVEFASADEVNTFILGLFGK